MQKTPALTVDCVIFCGEDVVLIRRGFKPFKGWYALPGGFVDIGESIEQACVRELFEETGLSVNIDELKLVGIYSDPRRDVRGHTVSISFLGQSNLDNLKAGDDAVSVEVVRNWEHQKIAFDHKDIIKDAWLLKKNFMEN